MVLKDWKKVESKDKHTQWFNSKTGVSVFVYFQTYKPYLKKKNHWVFDVGSSQRTILDKPTKNKAEALKLARTYMRKH